MKSVKDVVFPTSPSMSNSITIGCVFGDLYTFLKSHYHHEPLSSLTLGIPELWRSCWS